MPQEASNDTTDEQRALINELIDLQYQLMHTLQHSAIPEWIELDLTMAQLKTAFVVAQRGPLTVNAIAEILGVTQPTVSHLVERLVQVDIVERIADADDRRRTLVQLSPYGATLVERLHQGQRGHMYARLSRIAPDDLRALLQGIKAILRSSQAG